MLTQAGDSNKSSVAESTSCTTADAGVTRICTVREDTPGTYEAKLLGANDVLIAKAAVTVGTSVSVTGPKVNDNAGAADSVTLTYVKGVKWESKVGSGAISTMRVLASGRVRFSSTFEQTSSSSSV